MGGRPFAINLGTNGQPATGIPPFLPALSVGKWRPAGRLCGVCWNLAARRLGEQPHAGSYSAGRFSSSFEVSLSRALNGLTKLITSFSAFLKEPKATQVQTSRGSPLIPVTEWDKLGKAWTTQPSAPGSRKPALGTRGHYPPYSAGPGDPGAWRPDRGEGVLAAVGFLPGLRPGRRGTDARGLAAAPTAPAVGARTGLGQHQ